MVSMTFKTSSATAQSLLAVAAVAALGAARRQSLQRAADRQSLQRPSAGEAARREQSANLALAVLEAYEPKPSLVTDRTLNIALSLFVTVVLAGIATPVAADTVPVAVAWAVGVATFLGCLVVCEKESARRRAAATDKS